MPNENNLNREYKDRLFTFIFGREENREWTLSLYNAVNGSHYTDASLIEFNTLKDVLFMGMRNDTSFLISDVLNVYEHQSSYNRNMPLRMLDYVSDLYTGYIAKNKINRYRNTLIKLPTPKLVVFYNGMTEAEDEMTLRLSDSFDEEHRNKADVEVRVRMLNVNYGRNRALMEACKPLDEYSWFIAKIRENQKNHNIVEAVKRAINEMPEEFAIRKFLIVNKEEVEGMLDTEFNEEEVWQMFQNDVDAERKRADEAETRANEAETRADEAETRANEAKTRADEAEAERDKAKQQLQDALAEIARLKAAQ